jgi:hypothetical protein
MFNYKKKFLLISFFIAFIMFLSTIIPIMSSYEYRVRPGAFMEYTVTDARSTNEEGMKWWGTLDNGSYHGINLTKGSSIRVDVTEANETFVSGFLTFLGNLKSENISLDYFSLTYTSFSIVQQVTDKVIYQQSNFGTNENLQGNILTTKWEWASGNGFLKQETRLNIVSGWVEFFAYIFLVNETIDRIFSMTRSSPVTPGFEISSIFIPLLIVGIAIRIKSKK